MDDNAQHGHAIRPATAADASALTDIAFEAKASWGYAPDFMNACREELTYDAARLGGLLAFVAESYGVPAGFIAARAREIEALFVRPSCQRRGIGRALLDRVLACSAEPTWFIDADPHAEAIYRSWGFVTIGRIASGSIPGRTLPRMRLDRDLA